MKTDITELLSIQYPIAKSDMIWIGRAELVSTAMGRLLGGRRGGLPSGMPVALRGAPPRGRATEPVDPIL